MMRLVFMGSPRAAVPSLEALAAHPDVEVAGVVTQPDRPAGRNRTLHPCAVKLAAQRLGLAVETPRKAGAPEGMELIRAWRPHLILVCAYGQILPEALLELPPLGSYNLHFSRLPRWRGASPVQAAILAGDPLTGVSLQRMVMALDAGPLVASSPPLPIGPEDTAESLEGRLAIAAAELMAQALPMIAGGAPDLKDQDPAQVTTCKTISKQQGAVDWSAETAAEIDRKLRAYTPWPGCFTFIGKRRLALVRLEVLPAGEPGQPGVLQAGGIVATRSGSVRLAQVKPEGKRVMPIEDFLNGTPGAVGSRLTPSPGS